jgi:hypothetical protein
MARKLPGIMTYWVVARDESTGELISSKSYTSLKEARVGKVEMEDMADPPGIVTVVTIETMRTGERLEKFKQS